MRKPAILLAFADDRTEGGQALPGLARERDALLTAFRAHDPDARWQIEVLDGVTPSGLFLAFPRPDLVDRVAVFHYAGHAGGEGLLLQAASGALAVTGAEGLAGCLGAQQKGWRRE